jgi:hypothetical protein
MTRIEMQKTFLHFLRLHKKNPSVASSQLSHYVEAQNNIIAKKSRNRSRGFLFHHFAYGDPQKALLYSQEIMKNDPSTINKLIATVAMVLMPMRVFVLRIFFIFAYLQYRFSHV